MEHMRHQQQQRWIRWGIAGFVVVLAVVAISSLNFGGNLVYFYTPVEAKTKVSELAGKTIKIGAMVNTGSVQWDSSAVTLKFTMGDMQGNDINVTHKGSPPDLFKEGQGVVAEGRLSDNGSDFTAHRLMVKHSEEYQKPGDHTQMNRALIEDSMFKNQETSLP